jgi:hypothetical protein
MQVSVTVHLLMHRQIHFSVIFTGIRLQCCKSIVILSLHKGWPWVNNFLIVGGIWPHFQKWAAVLKTSNHTLPENPFVEGLVQILGAYLSYHSSALFEVCSFPGEVVSQFPVCLKSSAQDIVNTLASLLQGQHSVHGERIFRFSLIPDCVFLQFRSGCKAQWWNPCFCWPLLCQTSLPPAACSGSSSIPPTLSSTKSTLSFKSTGSSFHF